MCDIVGIVDYGARRLIDWRDLAAIRDHMATRGPDGVGIWLSDDNRIGFGHRRPEIIGLGTQWAQPMVLAFCRRRPEARVVVTFNGEIYNYRELRTLLEANGHVLRSSCDTEVPLHLCEDYGDALVDHPSRMYALGIWDSGQQRLLLARDPFGVRPLYYADGGGTFRFASPAGSLLACGSVSSTIDEGATASIFVLGSVPGPVNAVILGFDEAWGSCADETGPAALVAKNYGAEHIVEVISATESEASLPAFFAAMGQPSIDGLNAWFVSRAARAAGLKVALSGVGGDELTGGYSTFESVPRLRRRLRLAAAIPGLDRAARATLRAALPSSVNSKIASVLGYSKSLEQTWLLRRSVFLPWELGASIGTQRAVAALEDLGVESSVLWPAIDPDSGSDVSRVAALESNLSCDSTYCEILPGPAWRTWSRFGSQSSMQRSTELAAPRFRAWVSHRGEVPDRFGANPTAAAGGGPQEEEWVRASHAGVGDRRRPGFCLPGSSRSEASHASLEQTLGVRRRVSVGFVDAA